MKNTKLQNINNCSWEDDITNNYYEQISDEMRAYYVDNPNIIKHIKSPFRMFTSVPSGKCYEVAEKSKGLVCIGVCFDINNKAYLHAINLENGKLIDNSTGYNMYNSFRFICLLRTINSMDFTAIKSVILNKSLSKDLLNELDKKYEGEIWWDII